MKLKMKHITCFWFFIVAILFFVGDIHTLLSAVIISQIYNVGAWLNGEYKK